MLRRLAALIFLVSTMPVFAETGHEPRFAIQGAVLIFDTEADDEGSIRPKDADTLVEILRAHPEIETLQLNSSGGQIWASHKMSDTVIDFGLDTHVHGDCDSSCVNIFLGGKRRTMSRGSRIGFHQTSWSAGGIEEYYENGREESGWDTPFDFASWMYEDTQSEVYTHLKYMIARGVDPAFAIETLRKPSSGMWRPYRIMLRGVGVLTE